MSIVPLSDAKAWLRFPNPTTPHADDPIISQLIDLAEEVVEHRTGIVTAKAYTEKHNGGRPIIFLREVPVIEVNEVLESWGPFSYSLDYQDVSTGAIIYGGSGGASSAAIASSVFAFSVDNYEIGQVSRRSAANVNIPFVWGVDNIQVTYKAGRQGSIPAAIQIAAKELVAHIYQGSLQRGVSLSGANIGYDTSVGQIWSRDDSGDGGMSAWVGIPQRIIAMLESEKVKLPVIA